MRLQQSGEHHGHLFGAVRRSGDPGDLGDVPGIADRHPAERLHPLGEHVDERQLLAGVLVQQQVELVKVGPRINQWCFL
ncbi:hypothetical protein GCM10027615_44150 [Plantactinospora veratri]